MNDDYLQIRREFAEGKPPKLTIELVPETCWFSNVRTSVSEQVWDRLRTECYRAAGNRCQICNGRGPNWPVECHEIWFYDDKKHIQRLDGLIALCPACHSVKHIGYARVQSEALFHEAKEQLALVNAMTVAETEAYVDEAFRLWEERSGFEWKLDISILKKKYGVKRVDSKRPR